MTQAEAKRDACQILAGMIQNYLDVGGPQKNTAGEASERRSIKAFTELRDEMERRGGQK